MDATSAQGPRARLLHPGQVELTELESMILTCAVDAKLSKAQWDELLDKVGAENIEDLLELDAEDYDICLFKPLMKRRLEDFQSALYDKHWSKQKGNRDEADVPARGSGDAEPAAPPATRPPQPPPVPTVEDLCKKHKPSKHRVDKLEYWFFHAVSDGCKSCVKLLVHGMGVDKNAISESQSYTAFDFAEWSGQTAMKDYLETL